MWPGGVGEEGLERAHKRPKMTQPATSPASKRVQCSGAAGAWFLHALCQKAASHMREIARLHRALPLPPARARSRGSRCGRDPPIAFSFSSLRRPWPGSSGPGQQIRDLAGRHRPRLAEHPADASGLIAAAWPQDNSVGGWCAMDSRNVDQTPSSPPFGASLLLL